jgi:hypothetical protein
LKRAVLKTAITLTLAIPPLWQMAHADGLIVDTVYHPYVEAMSRELEYRGFYVEPNGPDNQSNVLNKYALGKSLNDRWAVEGYLITQQVNRHSARPHAVEFEVLHQLTEQGEYWADWGYNLELERQIENNVWELTSRLIMEKELGSWSHTANFTLSQEWGSDIPDELDFGVNVQSRYRLSPTFEPAIELYTGELTRSLGPAFLGKKYLGGRSWLKWEAGMQFGLSKTSPDRVYRMRIEYEF